MEKTKILKDVSFITTVFNEEKSVLLFLESLVSQTLMPEEIVVVDGGSSDNTLNLIIEYFSKTSSSSSLKNKTSINGEVYYGKVSYRKDNSFHGVYNPDKSHAASYVSEKLVFEAFLACGTGVKIFYAPCTKISQGRNIAVKNSSGKFICVSDGGCRLKPNWLYEITKYYFSKFIKKTGEYDVDVTGGYNLPYIKKFLHAVLSMCILPKKSEIDKRKFMPSSRNISFKRQVWETVGGFPEYMDYGEDMKFNFNIKKSGYKIEFNPDAEVYWNLRDNLQAVFKQFFRYAKGDAVGRMYLYRHIIRFLSFFVFLIIVAVSAVLSPWYLLLLVPLLIFYSYRPYSRINSVLSNSKNTEFIKDSKSLKIFKTIFISILSIPLFLLYIDIAKLSGYIYGLALRKKY
ncbi:MAG: glycosyltransferase [Actinobacteria bacterium]|nr:glycosyltransferase [Actinomycetota bacterium]